MTYDEFIKAKVVIAHDDGLQIEPGDINPMLKEHQKLIVQWMVRGGRRACFASFGLGKTMIQLEAVRLAREAAGGLGLIVIPLGVRQEFTRDAGKLGIRTKFIRRIEEVEEEDTIYLTNYETIRDGKLDPQAFTVASLDEASILRGFGGTKTFREFMATFAGDRKTMNDRVKTAGTRFRFVATATPSPNEYIELLAYAAFLGIMDVSAAKTRFFKRDSVKADNLTIHPHKEQEFWLWVASWGLFVRTPSDLGCSDEGYVMPELDVRWHEVEADHENAGHEVYGQARMFRAEALGVVESSREKRDSMPKRIKKVMEIINEQRTKECVFEGVLHQESGKVDCRPESQDRNADHARAAQGLSQSVLRSEQGSAARNPEDSKQGQLPREPRTLQGAREEGSLCAVRADAEPVSGYVGCAGRWMRDLHGESTDTDDGDRSRPCDGQGSGNSMQAVQHRIRPAGGFSGKDHGSSGLSDQIIVWCDLNREQEAIEAELKKEDLSFTSLSGKQDIDERERLMLQWRNKETSVFLSKSVMYGAGVNLQQCHTMIFSGINFKAQDLMQAVHRIHRFMQEHSCVIHIIFTSAEREVRRQLMRKWEQHNIMTDKMTTIIREFGLSQAAMAHTLQRVLGVDRAEVKGKHYTAVHSDCVKETTRMEENSVGLILTSIPFSTQYEYSPNYSDFGHTDNNEHFFAQMDFLTPNLLKILKPGRICAVHVKDRIVPGGMTGLGFQTVYPLHCKTIEHYVKHGFGYMGMKTIVTDVVRENNQTYRLGWTEQCKDGTKMGVGMPEYLLLFRKPPTSTEKSYADEPVVKSKEKYTRGRWQIDAHGFARSNGNRFLTPEELAKLPHEQMFKAYREFSLHNIYDFEHHVSLNDGLAEAGQLPVTFMLLQPQQPE